MDSEPPQTGAPISSNAPQRPLRIGRGDKYYEVLYVGGVAQERRLGRRTNQDEARNSFISDSQQQEQKEEHPVLDAQDLPVSELNPQPSVRRRRSRQGLAVQPTPPLRRHRPGSMRSKESTPSRESSDASFSEELVRENSTQPTLYALPEQDSEALSSSPVIVSPKMNPTSMIPIYDKPRHIYKTVEQDLIANAVDPQPLITTGTRARGQHLQSDDALPRHLPEKSESHSSRPRHGEDIRTDDEPHLRDADIQKQRQHDTLRQQQEEWQRQQQHKQQQEELASQQRLARQMQQQAELEERQRLELEKQQQTEMQKQRQMQREAEILRQQEAESIRQCQAEARRREEAEREQQQLRKQLQEEFQRHQQAELQKQQQAELQRQQQAELQRQQQAELQRQQQEELQRQHELQRQQQADLQRQHEAELQRQREADLQKQQRAELERQQTELQRQQQAEEQRRQEAEILERQQAAVQALHDQSELQGQLRTKEITPMAAQNQDGSQEQLAENLFRKSSQKSKRGEDQQVKATLAIPEPGVWSHERDGASPSRYQNTGADSPRRQRSRSPHSVRNVAPERHGSVPGESRALSEQTYAASQVKQTAPQVLDQRAGSDIPSGFGHDDVAINGPSMIQYVATTPLRAPVAHRETPQEPTLGTTSPESLVDWYENDDNFPAGADDGDEHDGIVKRKPSKIIRKIKGLFENKKADETPSSTSTERKRSDQLEPPPSPREPTTPTKRSKLGQFFSFNKKDERKRASPPPPLTFAPAVQGPEDIPDGMLAKVFRSKCNPDRGVGLPATPKTAPPFPNFRDWSPSTEDLSTVGTGKEKEFTKPSKYFVPKIPPFQARSPSSPSAVDASSGGPPTARSGASLLAPDAPEARNSPYSLCRNRGSIKGTSPRRTSLVDGNVDALYEQFLESERIGLAPNTQKPVEEVPGHTFARKPSNKAAAIPPELRAPIYQPMKDETASGSKQAQADSEPSRMPPGPPEAEHVTPGARDAPYVEFEEEIIEEEILEGPKPVPDNRNSIQELRPLFKQAWMLIDFMTQDLIDGVPKEAWSELRIFFLIMIGMLVLLYAQGVLRFAGNNPLCVIKALFKGFQILLGSAIQAGMAVHDAVDAMLTDASSKLVADTLNEI